MKTMNMFTLLEGRALHSVRAVRCEPSLGGQGIARPTEDGAQGNSRWQLEPTPARAGSPLPAARTTTQDGAHGVARPTMVKTARKTTLTTTLFIQTAN
jgi:hypothetical protein